MSLTHLITTLYTTVFMLASVAAQHKKIITIHTQGDTITHASVDISGNFYFLSTQGYIQKYDSNGKMMTKRNLGRNAYSLLACWNASKVFLYISDNQKYSWLDYELRLEKQDVLNKAFYTDVPLVSPSANLHHMWIYSNKLMVINKINVLSYETITTIDLTSTGNQPRQIVFMREYQNMIFVSHLQKGIYVFSHIGKLIKYIKTSNIHFFNFIGEDLYYQKENKMYIHNLYTSENRTITLSEDSPPLIVLMTDKRIVMIREHGIDFFALSL